MHKNGFTLKSCGDRHAFCNECRPDNKAGEHMLGRTAWNKGQRLQPRSSEQLAEQSARMRALWQNDEFRARRSAGQKAARQKYVDAAKRRWASGDFYRCVGPTCLEYAAQLLLEDAELAYEFQAHFKGFTVDFWLPMHGLIIEADGAYWHKGRCVERIDYNNKRTSDEQRDLQLLASHPEIKAVIRLSDDDLDPWTLKGGQ